MIQSDWSQFIPTIVATVVAEGVVAALGWLLSQGFRTHLEILTGNNKSARRWLLGAWLGTILILTGIIIAGVWLEMTSRQLTISVGYFAAGMLVLITLYFSFIWPLIRTANLSQLPFPTGTLPPPMDPTNIVPTSSPEVVPDLAFSNTQLHVTTSGDIILRTVISSIAENNRKPISVLLPGNFSIVEKYNNSLKNASIYSAKPSSTRADIIVLIDTSGSMDEPTDILDENGENRTKLQVVKEAVNLFFNDLSNSDISTIDGEPSRIAFLPFSTAGVNFLESDDGDIWFSTIPASRDEVSRAINRLTSGGDTPLYDAISHALNVIQESGDDSYKLLFCLTDGLDNHSSIYFETLLGRLQNSTVPVITVGYGQEGKYDSYILGNIALYSGAGQPGIGSFINVFPRDLSGVFRRLATDLNNIYEIRWKSSFPRPGNVVTASITVRFQLNTGQVIAARETRTYMIPVSGK
jgi:hypothetical protein